MGGRILEIFAYRGSEIEIMEWKMDDSKYQIGPGGIVFISPRDNYHGYPTGMGGRIAIQRSEFVDKATKLIELSEDWRE